MRKNVGGTLRGLKELLVRSSLRIFKNFFATIAARSSMDEDVFLLHILFCARQDMRARALPAPGLALDIRGAFGNDFRSDGAAEFRQFRRLAYRAVDETHLPDAAPG